MRSLRVNVWRAGWTRGPSRAGQRWRGCKTDALLRATRRNGIRFPHRPLLTQDPIGLAGGVNLYSYAGSNPVSYADPFGLCPIPPWTCVVAGAVVASRVAASPAGQRLADRGAALSARVSGQLAGMQARLGNIIGVLASFFSAVFVTRTLSWPLTIICRPQDSNEPAD